MAQQLLPSRPERFRSGKTLDTSRNHTSVADFNPWSGTSSGTEGRGSLVKRVSHLSHRRSSGLTLAVPISHNLSQRLGSFRSDANPRSRHLCQWLPGTSQSNSKSPMFAASRASWRCVQLHIGLCARRTEIIAQQGTTPSASIQLVRARHCSRQQQQIADLRP